MHGRANWQPYLLCCIGAPAQCDILRRRCDEKALKKKIIIINSHINTSSLTESVTHILGETKGVYGCTLMLASALKSTCAGAASRAGVYMWGSIFPHADALSALISLYFQRVYTMNNLTREHSPVLLALSTERGVSLSQDGALTQISRRI